MVPGLKEHVPAYEGSCGEGQGATGDPWLAEVQSPQEGQDERNHQGPKARTSQKNHIPG